MCAMCAMVKKLGISSHPMGHPKSKHSKVVYKHISKLAKLGSKSPPGPHRVPTGSPPGPHRVPTGSPPGPHRVPTGSPPGPHHSKGWWLPPFRPSFPRFLRPRRPVVAAASRPRDAGRAARRTCAGAAGVEAGPTRPEKGRLRQPWSQIFGQWPPCES